LYLPRRCWKRKRWGAGNESPETEVGITLKQSRKSSVIRLEGAIDIAAAAEFRKLLVEACGSGREVRVAVGGVKDLDVTAVQLIWAARRSAEAEGVAFTLSGTVPQSVSAALGDAGLEQVLFSLSAS
jgi:anti-anti-sigma factor